MSTNYIGLKLGSTTTSIFKAGNGVVLKEPTLIAMPTNPKNKEVYAVGNDAKKVKDRLPQNIIVYSPISNGVIQYEELALMMLRSFLKKVFPVKSFGQNIKAILCVPVGITAEEKKIFEITCFKVGIADVTIVPEVFCAAIGAGLDIQNEKASMVVDIGGNTTNIAIISNYNIVNAYNFSIGGAIINSAIVKYVNETYKLIISSEQAEQIKLEICSLIDSFNASIEIDGFNYTTNANESITLYSNELYPIIKHYYGKIASVINSIIQECDPQIIADISDNGINFFGDATSIIGLEKFMKQNTSFKSTFINNTNASMIGAGELIKYPQLLHKIAKKL